MFRLAYTIVYANRNMFLFDEGPTLETLDFIISVQTVYINFCIFRFASEDCLRRLFKYAGATSCQVSLEAVVVNRIWMIDNPSFI